ncbi:sugar ABC transporter ATP-binding protein [Robbsia andropogonis]|uniref:sugar ABC transporter ATP-binding protein n=1 Tax=Robbsia andropogonis TaxID=28092 RepID=UPI000463D5BC|nr:sugar ABC transporter ATP-binding protein [Robbsia andropogonis]MCP1120332.1 sugar ABC transporter ATP-binding protein [Robbsia andropogonis]MCP1130203.1 sugar ABC transporter ATP-binding protein [Robbsia andropogonis]
MVEQPTLLLAKSIIKSFGPTSVLKGFDLSVRPGEVHAFLGGNGAGKSTFIKIISGQHQRDGGTLQFSGRDIGDASTSPASTGEIAVVNQELALLPHLSVAENIAMPRMHRAFGTYSERTSRALATEALSLIDPQFARESVHRLVGELSLHERQLVEIARALRSGAKLLLLDEPTANLTAAETGRLFAVIRRLIVETNLAVLFVSHRMREIRQIADVCTIIRDGKTAVDRAPLDTITDREIIDHMGQSVEPDPQIEVNLEAASELRDGYDESYDGHSTAEAPVIVCQDDIEFEIRPGAIIGLAGAPTGPLELIEALTGIAPKPRWRIERAGVSVNHRGPSDAARAGVGYISGDRANKGMLATLPIIDNLMVAQRVVQRKKIVRHEELQEGQNLLDALKIRAGSLWHAPATLSGGTQQKVLVARWLNLKPQLLVLEEPTRGVDIRTKREIYALIRKLAKQGTAVVWWSTEYVELVELCDTVLAFDLSGRPTGMLRHPGLNETSLASATGMAA